MANPYVCVCVCPWISEFLISEWASYALLHTMKTIPFLQVSQFPAESCNQFEELFITSFQNLKLLYGIFTFSLTNSVKVANFKGKCYTL